MRILHVNTVDDVGGAAKVARKLLEAYRARGHQSWMAVGVKRTVDPDIIAISNAGATLGWARPWWYLHDRLRPHPGRLARAAQVAAAMASPRKIVHERQGMENFDFPGTRRLLGLTPQVP